MDSSEEEAKAMKEQVTAVTASINNILGTMKGLESWMPTVSKGMEALRQSVDSVSARVVVLETTPSVTPSPPPPLQPSLEMPQASGHRVEERHQGVMAGALTAPVHTLGKGEPPYLQQSRFSHEGARMPKTDFPKFNGDDPKWWKNSCEKYFHTYSVPMDTWATFATLHFTRTAALWLQTYEAMHNVDRWAELCVAVHTKFGRDKYQPHLEELENYRQTGTIAEYHCKFEELMHRVLIHNSSYDETFFVTKFVGGLKSEIRTTIKLHKPRTVDLALSLALTQEEVLEELQKKPIQGKYRNDIKDQYRHPFKPN